MLIQSCYCSLNLHVYKFRACDVPRCIVCIVEVSWYCVTLKLFSFLHPIRLDFYEIKIIRNDVSCGCITPGNEMRILLTCCAIPAAINSQCVMCVSNKLLLSWPLWHNTDDRAYAFLWWFQFAPHTFLEILYERGTNETACWFVDLVTVVPDSQMLKRHNQFVTASLRIVKVSAYYAVYPNYIYMTIVGALCPATKRQTQNKFILIPFKTLRPRQVYT